VEAYIRFPIREFGKIFRKLKRNSYVILVIHVGFVRQVDPLMELKWDAVVVFDERYVRELLTAYGEQIIKKSVIIPYPCPRIESTRIIRPEIDEGKFVFFSFGRQRPSDYLDYIYTLRKLSKKYDFVYWVLRSDGSLPVKEDWIIQEMKRPTLRELYSYLNGANVHLLPKRDIRAVVVSSTLAQTLYSGTPIVVPDTRHFELLPVNDDGFGVVAKYRIGDVNDLIRKLSTLIEDGKLREKISSEARRYASMRSEEIVAEKFITLIKSLQ